MSVPNKPVVESRWLREWRAEQLAALGKAAEKVLKQGKEKKQ